MNRLKDILARYDSNISYIIESFPVAEKVAELATAYVNLLEKENGSIEEDGKAYEALLEAAREWEKQK